MASILIIKRKLYRRNKNPGDRLTDDTSVGFGAIGFLLKQIFSLANSEAEASSLMRCLNSTSFASGNFLYIAI